ncbi:MAG TPA: right-handed parallel beta-helix repeat-containing protein [Nannocystis exedens]|nr:right-handed parallel beta-helix repeat-containing protein [Nannocystis exedens]
MRRTLLASAQTAAFLLLGVLMGACPGSSPPPEDTDSSSTGICEPGTFSCPCYEDDTCGPALICASNECIDDPALTTMSTTTNGVTTGPSTDSSSDSEATTSPSTGTGSTTTEDPECDPVDGVENPACGEAMPYCTAEGMCADCSAISCADVSGETLACDADSGLCVECSADNADACSGVTPVCSAASNTCVPCNEHSECESGACNLFSGACFPDKALWVDNGDSSCTPNGGGTQEKPFCEIVDAVLSIDKNSPTIIWVASSASAYTKKVSVSSSQIVAIRSSDSKLVRLEVNGQAGLSVYGGRVLIDHLQIGYLSEDPGVTCSSAGSIWADDSRIIDREKIGVDASSNCEMVFRRSEIAKNSQGGVQQSGGSLRMENTFVTGNGNGFSTVGGIATSQGTELELVYVSVLANDSESETGKSMSCSPDTSGVTLNSILLGEDAGKASVECAGLTFGYSVFDNCKLATGTNTCKENGLEAAWFVSPQTNDFHIKAGSMNPFKDAALWINGQPLTDYDGDPRPAVDGSIDYAGADVP